MQNFDYGPLELNGQYDRAVANYEEMTALARQRGDRVLRLAALTALATVRTTPNPEFDPAQGERALDKAVSLARELGDQAAEARLLWNLMLLAVFTGGDQHQAIVHGEESLALARQLDLHQQIAFTLNDLALPYWFTGELERAQAVVDEASELWRRSGNLPMLTDSLARSSVFHFSAGDYTQAVALSEEAFRISQSSNNAWGQPNSRFMLGNVYLDRGEPETAIRMMEEAIQIGEQAGHSSVVVGTRAELAWAYGTLGAIQHGFELAGLARDIAARQFPLFRPWALAVLARLHLLNGDPVEAETMVKESYRHLTPETSMPFVHIMVALADGELGLARGEYQRVIGVMDELLAFLEGRVRPFTTDALYLKAQALLDLGEMKPARQTLLAARAEAEYLGSRRTLWRILAGLSEIEAQRANTTEAHNLRRQARGIVEYIANHAGSPALRASFLSRPDVQAVVNAEQSSV